MMQDSSNSPINDGDEVDCMANLDDDLATPCTSDATTQTDLLFLSNKLLTKKIQVAPDRVYACTQTPKLRLSKTKTKVYG